MTGAWVHHVRASQIGQRRVKREAPRLPERLVASTWHDWLVVFVFL